MFNSIAFEIFIADGGVDDFLTMSDEELVHIIRRELHSWADDPDMLMFIVAAARELP